MNITVFGGAGFIGSNLLQELEISNYRVTLYDRNTKSKKMPDSIYKIIDGDFFTESNFDDILYNQDIVIHLISGVSPYTSMLNVEAAYNNDIPATLRMLEAARKNNVSKVIYLSSGGTVYGNRDETYLSEELFSAPINHYGIMKLTIEKILLLYNEIYKMNNIALRVANPYGPGQNPGKNIGAVSIFMDKILKGEEITIFGDGNLVRDYIEISDVTKSLIRSIEYKREDPTLKPIFNVGTGIGTSLLEVIKEIETITGKKAAISFIKERSIDAKRNVLDVNKAKHYLDFEASISLSDGIKNLYKHKISV